jgi:heme/copper-type cytochrome/quinol oxidase subunit 3
MRVAPEMLTLTSEATASNANHTSLGVFAEGIHKGVANPTVGVAPTVVNWATREHQPLTVSNTMALAQSSLIGLWARRVYNAKKQKNRINIFLIACQFGLPNLKSLPSSYK